MNNITGLNNFYIPNTLDGLNGIDSSISGSSLLLDGSNAMLSNLNVGTHKLINVVEPTVSSDGANKNYVDTAISSAGTSYLQLSGGTMSGTLNMGGKVLTNLPYPSANSTDAPNKDYVDINDALRLFKSGDTMTGTLNMGNNDIINIKMLKSVVGSDLTLQRGLSTVLQLTSSESIFSLPVVISSSLSSLVGINLNNSKK